MRNFIKCSPFFNVVASGVATLSLDLGMTINSIQLTLGGGSLTKAMLTSIKIKQNGKTVYETTGARLALRNAFLGIADSATILTIPFVEIGALNRGDRSLGAWATSFGLSAVTIEVTITGATTPTLSASVELDAPAKNAEAVGPICACTYHPVSLGAGGKFPVAVPFGEKAGGLLKRLMIYHANATEIEVKKDGVTIYEGLKTDLDARQTSLQRTPQAGLFIFDPIITGDLADMVNLSTAQSFACNVTVSGADTLHVYAETINHLNRI